MRPLNNWFYYGSRNLQIAFSDYYRELTWPRHKVCIGRREFATTVMPLIYQRSLNITHNPEGPWCDRVRHETVDRRETVSSDCGIQASRSAGNRGVI